MKKIIISIIAMCLFIGAKPSFQEFLNTLKVEALSVGISQETIERSFATIRFLPKVVALDKKQSEFTVTFEKYQQNQLPMSRVKQAVAYLRANKETFDIIETNYQVPREMIVALWGIESNFGRNTGGFHVLSSLASLAYDGRRHDLFKAELLDALRIIDGGHIAPQNMIGSWAGAMGQSQFMPSSFLKYAQDYTQDGSKDIWNAKADVWASIANYLRTEGWQMGQPTSVQAFLPVGFVYDETVEKNYRPLSDYLAMGVKLSSNVMGNPQVKIIKPDRSLTNASFVVFDNFYVILHWNRSYFFALTALALGDKIRANM